MDGLISVLRHGFKHRGIPFKVCYFKPESGLNQTAEALYEKNEITCNRQWFYSNDTHNSVDMVLAVNGIPVFALELKNQYTGQNEDHAKRQWMYDRDPREICFQFNKRILGYFCIDQLEVSRNFRCPPLHSCGRASDRRSCRPYGHPSTDLCRQAD